MPERFGFDAVGVRGHVGIRPAGVVVREYTDEAEGTMVSGADHRARFSEVVLRPRVVVDTAADALGGLDVLVNNAGIESHAPFWDVAEADYDRILNVNLKGVFFGSQAFVQHCRAQGRGGKIINISSVHEDLAFPNFAAYCASKGGLRMLARTLAVELGVPALDSVAVAGGLTTMDIDSLLADTPEPDAWTEVVVRALRQRSELRQLHL